MRYAVGLGTTFALACLIWLGFQVSAPSVEADESAQPHFTFSAEEDQRVLTIQHWGGMAFRESEFILWGDGRFQQIVRKVPGKEVVSGRETTLEFIEMNDLIGSLVSAGFMEWDDESVAVKVRQAIAGDLTISTGGRLYAPDDLGWTKISINLDSYQDSSGERQSPASITFSYKWSPHLFKRMFQPGFEVPEIDALIALQLQKKDLFSKKEAE